MPKRVDNIYDGALTFSKIRDSYCRTARRKKKSHDVVDFEMKLEDNILKIYKELKSEKYQLGTYSYFKVFEPKERQIQCLPFHDRVVQQLYVYEYIMPYMLKKFISTSYACIPKRGTHKCIDKLQTYMNIAVNKWENPYFVKYDISKFFYSINRNILYKIIERYYKDEKFLRLTKKFIGLPEKGDSEERGIPIGNYTSQYYANIYMNELDHYIKEELRVKYYIRYMDDGILIVPNKEIAKKLLEKIEDFVNNKLDLKLNKKSCYFPVKKGCIFCGYKVYLKYRLIKRSNINRVKKRIKKWNKEWRNKRYHFEYWRQSFYAWRGYAKFANTKNLIKRLEEMMEYIYDV